MRTLFLAVWFGSVLACLLKMGSPHRNPAAWIMAGLVGGLGSMVGLFLSRLLGISRQNATSTIAVAVAVSACFTLIYAVISRAIYGRRLARDRLTRPTIVF